MATTTTTKETKKKEAAKENNLLDAIHESQGSIVDLAQKWANDVGAIVPELWDNPIIGESPAPKEISDSTFDFVHKVLDAQRDFTKKIFSSIGSEYKKLS